MRKAKHLNWDETQMHVCGVCQSPFIIKLHESIGIHRCLECKSNLTSVMPNRRIKVSDYDVSDENLAAIKERTGLDFIARLEDDDGTPFLFRPETDEEMRERGEQERESMSNLPEVKGKITLMKFNVDDLRRQIYIGTDEMQHARVLKDVLKQFGHDSLRAMTQELHELRALKDAIRLHHPDAIESEGVKSFSDMMKEFNPADAALNNHGSLY